MKKHFVKAALALALCPTLLAGSAMASARKSIEPQNGGGRVIISEAGSYTLTGNMRGAVYVDPGAGDVTLNLDNATIDGGSAPGIIAVSGDSLTVKTAPGSVNSISSGSTSHDLSAAVDSAVPTTLQNDGRLNVNGGAANNDLNRQRGLLDILRSFLSSIVSIFRGSPSASSIAPVPAQQSPAFPGETGPQNTAPNEPQSGMNQNTASGEPQSGMTQNTVPNEPQNGMNQNTASGEPQSSMTQNTASGEMGGMTVRSTTDTAGEVVTGTTYNSAMDLEADYDSAVTYTVTDEDGNVKITESGTYIVTGSSSNGGITVKKGATGVVLILEDLDLTSTSGATLSVNKQAEVQVIVSGKVTLTDAENPADEYSEDADVADAYDGAAIKVKAESVVFITGDGELNVNGDAKNGIKGGDDSSIIIGGDVELNITAANDGINSNYDVTILSGDVTIDAEDDGIHADHILTIGDPETGGGPELTITDSTEGIEATVINVYGGDIDVNASDDAINAANGDGVYEGEVEYAYNQMGGDVTTSSQADGIDSNGNVNLIDGSLTIRSASNGGDAGIDYDGELYISGDFQLNNQSGVAGPDNMGGAPSGEMGGTTGGSGEMRMR